MRKELLNGLTDEQINKVKNCKSSEEIIELAKAEGVELNEEQLAAVSGGGCFKSRKCPKCGSKNFESEPIKGPDISMGFRCKKCGHFWMESWCGKKAELY